MKDKPALIVILVVVLCLVALFCVSITMAIALGYPLIKTSSSSPSLSLTVSPSKLIKGSESQIHIQMTNPGRLDLDGYTLLIGFAVEGEMSSTVIQTIPLSSDVGDVFEQDITWVVDYTPRNGSFEVRLTLLKPDLSVLTETSTAIEFVGPTMVISVTPTQLTSNSSAVIHIQVNNPSDADMNDYMLLIGYAPKDDLAMYSIRDIPLSLAAGETFEQDVPWDEHFVSSSSEYELRMVLLMPDGVVLTETKTPFTLDNK